MAEAMLVQIEIHIVVYLVAHMLQLGKLLFVRLNFQMEMVIADINRRQVFQLANPYLIEKLEENSCGLFNELLLLYNFRSIYFQFLHPTPIP